MRKCFSVFFIFSLTVLFSCQQESVRIKHSGIAQAEIISSQGTRVIIDAVTPTNLTSPVTKEDILTVTHTHNDHYLPQLVDEWAAEDILLKKGVIEKNGVKVTAIPAAHNSTDAITDEGSTNYIILIETDGLRICHLGDIGQDHFTQEQLDQLGEIDICFTQTENTFSNMNMRNKKGFILIDELKPHIVIMTHYQERNLEYAMENYPFLAGTGDVMEFRKKDIPDKTIFLIIDKSAPAYAKIYNLKSF